ncbi:MAG: hypothetical protein C0467_20230 [Planctomycetaceae bacterium]|nr:hypothetical protein [Planctomycetaceae bacterium]
MDEALEVSTSLFTAGHDTNCTGRKNPFEIKCVTIVPKGFRVAFTKAVEATTGGDPKSYCLAMCTHPTTADTVVRRSSKRSPPLSVKITADGMSATRVLDKLIRGHV